MPKRHVDLAGLPRHLHNWQQWYRGEPMLFLDTWPRVAIKDIEHWALMSKVEIVYPVERGPISNLSKRVLR